MKLPRLTDRPKPLRIKSLNELRPDFKPRWVKWRGYAGAIFIALGVLFVLAPIPFTTGIFILGFLVMFPIAHFSLFPKSAFAIFTGPSIWFPSLNVKVEKLREWLEFDLDWDENRR